MRIAICTDQYLPMLSGIADSVDILVRQLQTNGHEVRLYTLAMEGAEPEPHILRFPSYALPGSNGGIPIVLPVGAMRDIKRFKPDVIHTHLAGVVGFFALYASWRLSVPLVGTDHTFPADYLHYANLNFEPFRYLVRKFSSWYYNRCVFVTAPSKNMIDELTEFGLCRPHKVISNHIPAHIFRPLNKTACKQTYGIGSKAVLIFGRVATEKNLDNALAMFAQVKDNVVGHAAAELVVVGDGPYKKEFEQKVEEAGLSSSVRFLGKLRDEALVEAINACDVFLITSLSETQSMTTLQAMSCGLPVVAARAGGLPEYVHSGVNGYCIDPYDKKEFTNKLTELLNNPELCKTLGEAGRASVAKYSPEAITKQFEEIYQKVVL